MIMARPRPNILVVDDDAATCDGLTELLESWSYHALVMSSGQAALPRRAVPPRVGQMGSVLAREQVRGCDSSELFRQDTLIRLREIDKQVAQHERNIQTIFAEVKKRERAGLTPARASLKTSLT